MNYERHRICLETGPFVGAEKLKELAGSYDSPSHSLSSDYAGSQWVNLKTASLVSGYGIKHQGTKNTKSSHFFVLFVSWCLTRRLFLPD